MTQTQPKREHAAQLSGGPPKAEAGLHGGPVITISDTSGFSEGPVARLARQVSALKAKEAGTAATAGATAGVEPGAANRAPALKRSSTRISSHDSGLTLAERALRRKAKMATGQSPELPQRPQRRRHSDAGASGGGARVGKENRPARASYETPALRMAEARQRDGEEEVTSPSRTIFLVSDSEDERERQSQGS